MPEAVGAFKTIRPSSGVTRPPSQALALVQDGSGHCGDWMPSRGPTGLAHCVRNSAGRLMSVNFEHGADVSRQTNPDGLPLVLFVSRTKAAMLSNAKGEDLTALCEHDAVSIACGCRADTHVRQCCHELRFPPRFCVAKSELSIGVGTARVEIAGGCDYEGVPAACRHVLDLVDVRNAGGSPTGGVDNGGMDNALLAVLVPSPSV
eukprot:6028839-Prymnesium_polylepis.1